MENSHFSTNGEKLEELKPWVLLRRQEVTNWQPNSRAVSKWQQYWKSKHSSRIQTQKQELFTGEGACSATPHVPNHSNRSISWWLKQSSAKPWAQLGSGLWLAAKRGGLTETWRGSLLHPRNWFGDIQRGEGLNRRIFSVLPPLHVACLVVVTWANPSDSLLPVAGFALPFVFQLHQPCACPALKQMVIQGSRKSTGKKYCWVLPSSSVWSGSL